MIFIKYFIFLYIMLIVIKLCIITSVMILVIDYLEYKNTNKFIKILIFLLILGLFFFIDKDINE